MSKQPKTVDNGEECLSGLPSRIGDRDLTGDKPTITPEAPGGPVLGAATPPGPQSRIFKKCKSATFHLDGTLYTIGEMTR